MAYEKMPCLYDTVKDLNARLNGTICRYKGLPVYVVVEATGKLQLYDPPLWNTSPSSMVAKISAKDPDFDISSAELGYLNWRYSEDQLRYLTPSKRASSRGNVVSFLQRAPVRRWNQGLVAGSVVAKKIDGATSGDGSCELFSEGFKQMVSGVFPSFPEAAEMLFHGQEDEVAISIDFAIKRTESSLLLVYYQCRNIGYIEPNKGLIKIPGGELEWVYRRLMSQLRSL